MTDEKTGSEECTGQGVFLGPLDATVATVAVLAVERDLRHGFKDNHGRTWVRCAPGDTGGTFWNVQDGQRVRCRLKYPHEYNAYAVNFERKMRQTSEDNYIGDGGYRMQREDGQTPNGNSIGRRWVLRGPEGEWIDCGQYRHDLLARHGFVKD